MTPAELGQKVKAKYPQYQNVDDSELGNKVATKYPQYQAMLTEAPAPNQVAPKSGNSWKAALGDEGEMSSLLGMTPEAMKSQAQENRAGLLPMAGQAIGSGLGGGVGATAGAMIGQSANQAIKAIPGQKFIQEGKPSIGEVGKEGLITGLIEGVTRGTGKLIFRRQIANKQLSDLGMKLGEMKKALSANPNLGVASEEVYLPLKQSMEEVAVPHGPQSTIMNKWLRFMEKNPKLSAKNLIEMEKDLGEVAKYGEFEKGAFVAPTIKKPALNSAAKDSRRQVSGIVDTMAEESGQKGFGDISRKISKLLENPDKTDVTKSSGHFLNRVIAGSAAGGITQNPLVGIATYLGLEGLQSPELRNAAFKVAQKPAAKAAGTATRLTLADLARKASK